MVLLFGITATYSAITAPPGDACGSVGQGRALRRAPLSPDLAEALFGSNLTSYDHAAVIRLHNLGAAFQFGIDSVLAVGDSILEPGIAGEGRIATSGTPGQVKLSDSAPGFSISGAGLTGNHSSLLVAVAAAQVPEPGTWLSIAAGLLFLARRSRAI